MATTTRDIPALPERIWAVLAEPTRYAEWVVGTKGVHGSDGDWPARDARFHHTVGIGPLHLHDSTSVLESEPPCRLVLRVRVRPLGHARVVLELTPSEVGTRVVMTEEPTSPLASLGQKILEPVIHARNVEALRRLEGVVCPAAV
jgi:uncharacterized protein YndB with AHSA1/START domain